MGKSFCSGCIFWVKCPKWMDEWFNYCSKFNEHELDERIKLCNGKYKKQAK